MGELNVEIESWPGRVVLRFAKDGETTEYPVSADAAAGLADRIDRASDLE